MRRGPADPDRAARPEFEFRSPPHYPERDARPDERRARIGSAIRAAHGGGVSFEWRIRSGPGSAPRLCFSSTEGVRWWTDVLLPAYEYGGWRPTSASELPRSVPTGWFAARVRDWPLPVRTSADPESWIDALSGQLELAPEGYELRWGLRPAPLPRASRPLPTPAFPSGPGDRSHPRGPRALGPPTAEPPDLAPAWWCRTALLGPEGKSKTGESRRIVRALESATRSVNGNGLRFLRRRWPGRTLGPEFIASESDVRDSFPMAGHRNRRIPPLAPRILALGRRNDGRPVGTAVETGQGRHLAVLGETGMGKSSLLTAICRSVARDDGLVLFDPLGDTARAVRAGLSGVVPDRIRWIDPNVAQGLNALHEVAVAPGGAAGSERRLNDLVHALRRVREGRFVDGGFWGPRLEEMLGRALRAAAALPGGTLLDAHALLAAEGRGFRQVPPESMDAVRALADRVRARPEDADGARRLLFEVVRNGDLVRLLCSRDPAYAASDLVQPGGIVLLSGDASVVGESTARYLLSVFLALVWAELLARPSRSKTWVVLDEAQWFAHEAVAEMLRMARRCNVHVVLATQAVGSLPEPVREALWTNVADFVLFRGSPADARELARSVRGVSPESILSLPRGEAFLLLGKGNAVERIRTARAAALTGREVPLNEGIAGPTSPSTSPRISSTSDPSPGPGLAGVLAALDRRARDAGGSSPFRVSLGELRLESDPGGQWVRELGDRLTRSGAILATGRDEAGSFWWVDPARVRSAAAEAPDGDSNGPEGEVRSP
jgi:hypothetical protein